MPSNYNTYRNGLLPDFEEENLGFPYDEPSVEFFEDYDNSITDIDNIQFENPEYFSDHFVQNAAFFRLDHITASYRFDNVYKDKGSITISATLQNPLVITPYSGVDPEVSQNLSIGNAAPGIDVRETYYKTRAFTAGINLSF